MTRAILLASAAASLGLAACTPAGDRPAAGGDAAAQPPATADDSCGAGKVAGYLGQLPTTDAIAEIQKTVGHTRIRTIRPGDAVTMDYREDRLNIEIGDDGRIRLLRCG
jgi:ABC-type amino acid transport substrate-binding protein